MFLGNHFRFKHNWENFLPKISFQECKTLFEELSGIMRTVLASRSEIVEYDKRQQLAVSEKPNADVKVRVRSTVYRVF